jgi:hypothetical protein
MNTSHLIVRKDHVLCTRCMTIEPVHPGDGTPMSTMIEGYKLMAMRHQTCERKGLVGPRRV